MAPSNMSGARFMAARTCDRATLPDDRAQLCLTDVPVLAPALHERQVACVHADAAPPTVVSHDPAEVTR